MRTLTITRALCELKLLKKRHQKQLINDFNLIAVKHGSKLKSPYSSYKEEDFEAGIDPTLQSIEKLESMIFEIKSKIEESNSKTIVKIGSKEMTVRDAIIMKDLISLKSERLSRMKSSLELARNSYESALRENQASIDRQLSDLSSKSSGKVDPDAEKSITNTVNALYEVKFIDHGLSEKIKKLETEIEDFTSNVDFALSESNSITTIEVSD